MKALKRPGRYGDGGGLYLVVTKSGSKQWVQRIVIDGKRRDLGLGGFPTISLRAAREKALDNKTLVRMGGNPLVQITMTTPTFKEMAQQYISLTAPRWRSPNTRIHWERSLENYVYPLVGGLPVDRIERGQVLQILTPIWTVKSETGRKLRRRMRAIFAAAMAHGHIELNPAGEIIDAALPSMPAVKAHYRALPYQDVPAALETVDESPASWPVKLAFRFLVLTAARSGEVRGATWDEIDLDAATWTIPGSRMKAGREHRVPLSTQAIAALRAALPMRDDSNLLFPSTRTNRALSDMTFTKLLRDVGLADRATAHGFRTSFKTWCMERTNVSWAVGESALAHTLGNSTEAAYARSDLFEKRRNLMQNWGEYVAPLELSLEYEARQVQGQKFKQPEA